MKKLFFLLSIILSSAAMCLGQNFVGYYSQGVQAYEKKQYKTAVQHFQKARMLGKEGNQGSDEYLSTLEYLAKTYEELKDYDNTEIYYKALEAAFMKTGKSGTAVYPDVLERLAETYIKMKQYPKAAKQYDKVLLSRAKINKENSAPYIKTLHQVGKLYATGKKYTVAVTHYEKLVKLGETFYKGKGKEFAAILEEYGNVLIGVKKYESAVRVYDRAIQLYGAEKMQSAQAILYKRQALAYESLRKKPEAIKAYVSYVEKGQGIFKNNEDYLKEIDQVRKKLHHLEADEEAEKLVQHKMEIVEGHYGKNSPEVANILMELSQVKLDEHDIVGAQTMIEKALAIRKEKLGEKDPAYAQSLDALGYVMIKEKKIEEAEKMFKQAMDLRKLHLAKDHADYITGLNHLAIFYVGQNKLDQAEPLVKESMATTAVKPGKNHTLHGDAISAMGTLLLAKKNFKDAEPLFKKACNIKKNYHGPLTVEHAVSVKTLADFYKSSEKPNLAIQTYRRAISIYEGANAKESEDVKAIYESIAEINGE